MTKKKKKFDKKYLYIIVGIIIVFSIILFLLLGKSKTGPNFKGVHAYKYKTGMEESTYFLEKITSSKIAIEETYNVKCANSKCYFLNGYFANGNRFDSMAVLYDESYYLIDFVKNTKEEFDVGNVRYVNFTDDGSYVFLFTSNNSFYAYNISNKTISKKINYDYIVYDNSFNTLNNKIFIYSNGEYRLVNLDTGKLDKTVYDNVKHINNYYVLTYDGKEHLYSFNKKLNDLDVSFDRILDIKDNYVLVVDDNNLLLMDYKTKDTKKILNKYNYDYINMNYDSEFVNITLSNKNCYSVTYSLINDDVNTSSVECPSKGFTKNIYVSSNKDENIVITYGKDFKDSYDLTVTNNGFLYDIYGKYYDNVAITNNNSKTSFESGFDITRGTEFSFLKEKFELLDLNNKIKNDYYNKLMPLMLSNKENFIYFDIDMENSNDEYKVLNNLDSYVSIDIYILSNYQNIDIENLNNINNSGLSVVVMSIS